MLCEAHEIDDFPAYFTPLTFGLKKELPKYTEYAQIVKAHNIIIK